MKQKNVLLHLSISMYIKDNIDKLFSTLSIKERNKIYFLIHQINKLRTLDINISVYSSGLSMKNGELTNILKLLKENNIIKRVDFYKIGVKPFTYSMVSSYNNDSSRCYKKTYNFDHTTCPIWVKQYIANGGEFRKKINCNPINKHKTNMEVHVEELLQSLEGKDQLIDALETKNIELETKIELLTSVSFDDVKDVKKTNDTNCIVAQINNLIDRETIKEFDYHGNPIRINNFNFISDYAYIDIILFNIDQADKGQNIYRDRDFSFTYEKSMQSTYDGDIITATILI